MKCVVEIREVFPQHQKHHIPSTFQIVLKSAPCTQMAVVTAGQAV